MKLITNYLDESNMRAWRRCLAEGISAIGRESSVSLSVDQKNWDGELGKAEVGDSGYEARSEQEESMRRVFDQLTEADLEEVATGARAVGEASVVEMSGSRQKKKEVGKAQLQPRRSGAFARVIIVRVATRTEASSQEIWDETFVRGFHRIPGIWQRFGIVSIGTSWVCLG
ncbi:hypothetical protein M5K25_020771 [Dendrobium thyrsiflorum]|uniref:Uncharacterized protein n=1 Tax=Dendrobium thyrsiflorum TaxID=117978 RepID=A0ABD0UAT8_DENTH